jgi:glucokinase
MAHIIADIGGTNARFAIVQNGALAYESVLKCAAYAGLKEAVEAYCSNIPDMPLTKGAFALAGPVTGEDSFTLTNHPWAFSISETQQAIGLDQLEIFNDFQAIAMSIGHIEDKYLHKIGGGTITQNTNIGIIGPGTGLGVAGLIYDLDKKRHIPMACEGGHVTMPAKSQREFDIFQWLVSHKYSHVSAERVCSGKGMQNLYRAMRFIDRRDDLPERLEPADIAARGLSGECDLCAEIIDMVFAFLGRVGGNLALTLNATGGIYIAGGIIPKLGLDRMEASRFRAEFSAKGRFKDYVGGIATIVVDDPFMALSGLKAYVSRND